MGCSDEIKSETDFVMTFRYHYFTPHVTRLLRWRSIDPRGNVRIHAVAAVAASAAAAATAGEGNNNNDDDEDKEDDIFNHTYHSNNFESLSEYANDRLSTLRCSTVTIGRM